MLLLTGFRAMNGYAEQARLADCTRKHENLAARLAEARTRAAALHDPEELLRAIRSGDPELRLKLKAEAGAREW